MENFLEIKRILPGAFRRFAFADDLNGSSLSLLFRNRVRIRPKKILGKREGKYRIVVCDVRKKDAESFARAMEELKNKMLLIGNLDYEAFCGEFFAARGGT